jgi:hypothetical protein
MPEPILSLTRRALPKSSTRKAMREIRRRAYALAKIAQQRAYDEYVATMSEEFFAGTLSAERAESWVPESPPLTEGEQDQCN